MTFDEVVIFLERKAKETFDAGVFHQDEFGTHSATEDESMEFAVAAEALKDFRVSLFGEDGP